MRDIAWRRPAERISAHGVTIWLLDKFNVQTDAFQFDPTAIGIQVIVGISVPVLAALMPALGGARAPVRQAIAAHGLSSGFGQGWLDRAIGQIRGLPRLVALGLRNTFRRKARVSLTLMTLMLGGAIFIMVMSVAASLDNTLDILLHDLGDDVSVWFDRAYRVERLIEIAQEMPGVVEAEAWRRYGTMLKLEGGGERFIGL